MENQAAEVTAPPDSPKFQHYEILSRLGQGGYGEVFEAWDSKLRRKVAIKRHKAFDPLHDAASLINEARLTASLQHPAFAQIFSIEEDDQSQAIVMELIEGQTWRQLMKENPPDLATALGWMAQLAEAMQAAHDSGLTHGDLKPSNLMLDPAGKVRILDLGLAFHDDAQTTTSVIQLEQQGTIAYMAPEVLLGAMPGRQTDIYAMGVILFELVTGARPFANMSGLALAAALMQSSSVDWTFPDSVPKDLVDLIRAMTARRPDQRSANMRLVQLRIERCTDQLARIATGNIDSDRSSWSSLATGNPWVKRVLALTRGRRTLVAGTAVLALGMGCWHLAVYMPSLSLAMPTFSKAQAISRALTTLQQSPHPERLDAAERDFTAILEADPDSAAAVAGLSLVYSFRYLSDKQDETWLQRAAASAQQALKLDNQLALSHAAQAWVLTNRGQHEAALAECERAIALEPGHFFASVIKSATLRRLRRYDEARAWIEQAIEKAPAEHSFADELGSIFFEQGNYSAAEKAFRHSIQLQPDSAFAYANLNTTLLRLNRSEESLRVLQQGLQVRPNGMLYSSLGNALFARGDYVGAADAFQSAVTPPTGNPNNYLRWANLGDALLWIPGKTSDARNAYQKALALLEPRLLRTPQDATLMSRMGLYSIRAGNSKRGSSLLNNAVSTAPTSPDVLFRAGLAYELLGERELALAALAQAKKNGYPASSIDSEPDLVGLRRDPRYLSTPIKGAIQ